MQGIEPPLTVTGHIYIQAPELTCPHSGVESQPICASSTTWDITSSLDLWKTARKVIYLQPLPKDRSQKCPMYFSYISQMVHSLEGHRLPDTAQRCLWSRQCWENEFAPKRQPLRDSHRDDAW